MVRNLPSPGWLLYHASAQDQHPCAISSGQQTRCGRGQGLPFTGTVEQPRHREADKGIRGIEEVTRMIPMLVVLILTAPYLEGRTLEEIVADLKVANDRQNQELADVKEKLDWTWTELTKAEDQIKAVAMERDGWRAYGTDQHDKWMNAEKRLAADKAALLRRDIIIGLLTLAIGVWAFLKFYLHIPFL